jgi:hypothetical protein
MPRIKRITNPNKLVEEKVNYFLDQITHVTTYAGWHWHLELESPISLLEKIIFRLTNDNEYRLTYFDNYFKHSFFTSDTFWSRYKTYPDIEKLATQYNQLGKKQKGAKISLLSDVSFHNNLQILHKDLTHKMASDLMNGVIKTVLCPHKLEDLVPHTNETHAAALKSIACALVSAYIFKGYTKGEISEIITKVFSKDATTFPFPPHVKTKTQRKKHLAKGTLKNQLHGFTNALKLDQERGIIMVKVYGGIFPQTFEFKYNQVDFYGKNHSIVRLIKGKMASTDIVDFFSEGDYILATAEIGWHSQHSLLDNIVKKIRGELAPLSASLDRNFNVDTTTNYIWLSTRNEYKGMAWSSRKFDNPIPERALEQLSDNAYQALGKLKGTAVNWFLKYEPLFVQAHMNCSISDYWLYLEILLSYNQTRKAVMDNISSIVLLNEKLMNDRRILTTIVDSFTPFSGGFQLLNVTKEKWRKVIPSIRKGKIPREIRNVDYPFLKELINEYDNQLDAAYYKKAKVYYSGILTEAYEYRNFIVHSGSASDASKDKLASTLPNIVVRTRWAFFNALKNGEHNTPFDLIIENLVKQGDALLDKF